MYHQPCRWCSAVKHVRVLLAICCWCQAVGHVHVLLDMCCWCSALQHVDQHMSAIVLLSDACKLEPSRHVEVATPLLSFFDFYYTPSCCDGSLQELWLKHDMQCLLLAPRHVHSFILRKHCQHTCCLGLTSTRHCSRAHCNSSSMHITSKTAVC